MTCLGDFSLLTVERQMEVLEQMLQDKRDDQQARAERFNAAKFSPPATAPVPSQVALSPESAVAGTSYPMEHQS